MDPPITEDLLEGELFDPFFIFLDFFFDIRFGLGFCNDRIVV